jgi:hypothetical protein
VLLSAICLALGCSSENKANRPDESPPVADISTPVVSDKRVVAQIDVPIWFAESMVELTKAYDSVVVGQVISSENISCPAVPPVDPDHEIKPPPTNDPKYLITPEPVVCSELPPSATKYSIRIIESVQSNFKAGDVVEVGQIGGIKDGVEYYAEGDPVYRMGTTYLLFLGPADPTDPATLFESAPFGKFLLDDAGRLTPVDPIWASLPAVAELTGVTLEEANSLVAAASSSAPAP